MQENIIITIVVLAIGIILIVGIYAGITIEQNKAIKANVAEWVVDSKTGQTTFTYKGIK